MLTKDKAVEELMQEDGYECNIFAKRAERIVQELTKTALSLLHRGYGTTNLFFSDCSFVSLTDSGAIGEVEALLRAGFQPLGCIAPERDSKRSPFVEPWESSDRTLVELRRIADWVYGHRMRARDSQL